MLPTALELQVQGRATYTICGSTVAYIDCISESQYQVVEKDQDSDNDARDQGNTPHLKNSHKKTNRNSFAKEKAWS